MKGTVRPLAMGGVEPHAALPLLFKSPVFLRVVIFRLDSFLGHLGRSRVQVYAPHDCANPLNDIGGACSNRLPPSCGIRG